MAPRSKPADQSAIAQAAIRCFKRYGIHRTSMADVAQEAGLSRQTVYRFFATRSELLEHIAIQRLLAMVEKESPYFRDAPSLQAALVEGPLLGLRIARADKLFQEIVDHGGEHAFDQFLFRGSPSLQNILLQLWAPLLDKARAEGKLRSGVTNEYAAEWIRSVQALLVMRDEDEATQRKMLETFLVPSLVAGVDEPAASQRSASLPVRREDDCTV